MGYDNNDNSERKIESVFSKRIRAGKRRTYFFDVRATRGNDYFLTITESRKRFDDNGYDRHKIFVYKEDFNKFIKALNEAVDYVKTDLMPDFDFDAFNHEYAEGDGVDGIVVETTNGESVGAVAAVSVENEIEEPLAEAVVANTPEAVVSEQTSNNLSTEEVDKW